MPARKSQENIHVQRIFETGESPPLELTLYYAGQEDCAPGHSHYGVRDHFLMHYVFSGQGQYCFEGRTIELQAGDGFVLFPHRPALYRASATHPWSYGWVGFSGALAESHLKQVGIGRHHPYFRTGVHSAVEDCCRDLVSGMERSQEKWAPSENRFYFQSLLYRLFNALSETLSPPPEGRVSDHIQYAIQFLQRTHSRPVTIEETARHVGIDRKYLSALFKKSLGVTTKEYLTHIRLTKAAGLLRGTDLPVFAVAHSVGYTDELYFSKAFRAAYRQSPTAYRAHIGQTPPWSFPLALKNAENRTG